MVGFFLNTDKKIHLLSTAKIPDLVFVPYLMAIKRLCRIPLTIV